MSVTQSASAKASQLHEFQGHASTCAGRKLGSYDELHRWACESPDLFWQHLLQWCDLETTGNAVPIVTAGGVETARFFPELRLNYAKNLLRPLDGLDDHAPAILGRSESGDGREISRAALRNDAMAVAGFLRSHGVRAGDRIVAIARNTIECATMCLGATAIGAIWSSISPDLGTAAVTSRFRQLDPTVLISEMEYVVNGMKHDLRSHLLHILRALPSIRVLITLDGEKQKWTTSGPPSTPFHEVLRCAPLDFDKLDLFPFNHPLFILFSSGTTGPPKCIVHGAGGTLLEHVKEHRLHLDLRPGDRLCFITSTGWMMWNWQLSALASGAAILLYEGSVIYPDAGHFWRELDRCDVTVMGLSPAYVQLLRQLGFVPKKHVQLRLLRAIESTGSILFDELFDWLTACVKDVPVQTISGGTDIIGCFVLGNPLMPVVRGEAQCISLGLDVRIASEGRIDDHGTGELVCVRPFPSRPIGFWGDVGGERYHASYFVQNPPTWTHGDRISISEQGSVRLLGRSDGILNVRGVRIGPAEIYSIVLQIPGVRNVMAIAREDRETPGGAQMVLLVVADVDDDLASELKRRIKHELAAKASAVHVPDYIFLVSDLPQTHNGKLSERAARDAINGRDLSNRTALKNPDILSEIVAKAHELAAIPA